MGLLIITTLAYFTVFALLSVLVFYTLGFTVISFRAKSLSKPEIIALSLAVGLVLFVLLAVIFGLLHIRIFTLPVILGLDLYLIVKFKTKLFSPWAVFLKEKILLLMILLGIFIQGMINFPSGFLYSGGLYFWSSQGHDGLWHVALIEEIKKSFPPQNPIFSGEALVNYHYLIDVAMGEFARIFPFFSSLDLYFRFFPVMLSIMIGLSVFAFVNRWQEKKGIAFLAMFFTYFVGSFGYVVNYIKGQSVLGGETVFWAAQGNTILGNPPHASSYALVPAFLLAFYIFTKSRDKYWFMTSFILVSVLAGFKVSGGLVILVGLGFAALIDLVFNRKWSILALTGVLGLSNFLTFKTMTAGAGSFLMFLPWWFIRTMVVAGNRLDWIDLENQRQHYLEKGTWHAYLRVVQVESIAFAIFLFGNLGMRFVGFFEIIRKFLKGGRKTIKDPFEVALFITMLTGFIMPVLFVQKGIIYNNIQFMQYFLLIFGFYGAVTVYNLLMFFKTKAARVVIMAVLMIFSVPTVIGNLAEFYGPGTNPLSKVTNAQLEALKFLKDNSSPDDIVLNQPYNKYFKDKFKFQPKPIYAWYSTAFIPALTGRRTYLSSEEQALITGYPTEERIKKMKSFFMQEDILSDKQFLESESIKFVYISKDEIEQPFDPFKVDLNKFFENEEVIIYRI